MISFLELGPQDLDATQEGPRSKHNIAIQLILSLCLTSLFPFFSPDSQPLKRPKPSAHGGER